MTTDYPAVLHDALATLNTVDQSPAWRAERDRCIARIKHALGMKLETWQTAILLVHGYIGKDDEPLQFSMADQPSGQPNNFTVIKPATEENPMASQGWTDEEERIGWRSSRVCTPTCPRTSAPRHGWSWTVSSSGAFAMLPGA